MMTFCRSASLLLLSCLFVAGGQVASAATEKTFAELGAMDVAAVQRLADAGQQNAQLEMASRYVAGNGVDKDEKKAVAIVTKLSGKNAEAMYMMGAAYANGIGVPQDDRTAVRWFERSARKGNAHGELWYGVMLATGRAGKPADWKAATPWIEKSAAAGYSQAALQLGFMYERGCGYAADPKMAATWYRRANAIEFNAQAQWNLSLLLEKQLVQPEPGDPKVEPGEIAREAETRRMLGLPPESPKCPTGQPQGEQTH